MTTGQKDMLALKTSMNSMSGTSAATATPVSIMTASMPGKSDFFKHNHRANLFPF